jgi:hypothetical protein
MRIYTEKKRITYEMADYIGKEKIIRDLGHRLIDNMNIDHLRKFLHFHEFDPRAEISKQKMANPQDADKGLLEANFQEQTVEYEITAKVNTQLK